MILGAAVLLAAPAAALLHAADDTLVLIEGDSLAFDESELLANDATDGGAWVEVLDWPDRGTLTVSWAGPSVDFHFDPVIPGAGPESGVPGFVGRTSFRYRLVGPFESSAPASVHLVVLPSRWPLAGAWETNACHRLECFERQCQQAAACACDVGVGADFGWWSAESSTFTLCDWRGFTLHDELCLEYPVPAPSTALPLVGDWNGDGFDDVGVVDLGTGVADLYLVRAVGCAGTPHCLEPYDSRPVAPSAGPFAGRWNDGTSLDQLGRLRWSDGRLFWPTGGGEASLLFAGVGPHVEPVAGAWSDHGADGVGLYDQDAETFYLDVDGMTIERDVSPWIEERQMVPGAAFAGRTSLCGPALVGFSDRSTGGYWLFEALDVDTAPIVVKVPVDPDDGSGG